MTKELGEEKSVSDSTKKQFKKHEHANRICHLTLASTSPSCRCTYDGTRVSGTTNVTNVLKVMRKKNHVKKAEKVWEKSRKRKENRQTNGRVTVAALLHCVEGTKL